MTRAWKIIGTVVMLIVGSAVTTHAQIFNTLVNFDGINGVGPYLGSLVQGADGSLYGTTLLGGANANGTIFKITRDGTMWLLYSFCSQPGCTDGSSPVAGLVLATDGNLYGTTGNGGTNGYGTVFKITPGGTLTTLHSFAGTDGFNPTSTLIQAADGNFYGTANQGGAFGYGTVFRITLSGALTALYHFDGTDGSYPVAGLVQGVDGNLYGTTAEGGTGDCLPRNGCGTAFTITPPGTLTTLHNFDGADGEEPYGTLVQATDRNLYGTTVNSTTRVMGTVFRLTPSGHLTTIHSFKGADGSAPEGKLIQSTDGNLYGTTFYGGDLTCNAPIGCGTVFAIAPGGHLTTLHTFESTDGMGPYGGLLQHTNGGFYGTTYLGGTENEGTVFRLDMGLGPFVTFVRAAGHVGQSGPILGQGFRGTTSVELNGIPADFTVVSDDYIRATVPAGGTTGYVIVTTPSGTLTSNVPFRVIP